MNGLIYVYGYENLLRNAVKQVNLEGKNIQFAIIN